MGKKRSSTFYKLESSIWGFIDAEPKPFCFGKLINMVNEVFYKKEIDMVEYKMLMKLFINPKLHKRGIPVEDITYQAYDDGISDIKNGEDDFTIPEELLSEINVSYERGYITKEEMNKLSSRLDKAKN